MLGEGRRLGLYGPNQARDHSIDLQHFSFEQFFLIIEVAQTDTKFDLGVQLGQRGLSDMQELDKLFR